MSRRKTTRNSNTTPRSLRVTRSNRMNQRELNLDESIDDTNNQTSALQTPLQTTSEQFLVPNGYRLVKDHSPHDDIEVLHQDNLISKSKIQFFKGFNDIVTVENWIKRFEIISNYFNWNEKKKSIMIGNFLIDDALNYYIENYTDNWTELKSKMISRFGHDSVDPIVEFINIKYDIKKGIKEYFDQKRRLGVLAGLTEEQMIPLMIQGLHPKMISHFVAIKPKTFNEFYRIAKSCEDNYKQFTFQNKINFKHNNNNNKTNENKSKFVNPNNKSYKKRPPNPCRICEGLGFANRYHWISDCKNNSKLPSNQTNTKQINFIEQNSNSNDDTENNIEHINLN